MLNTVLEKIVVNDETNEVSLVSSKSENDSNKDIDSNISSDNDKVIIEDEEIEDNPIESDDDTDDLSSENDNKVKINSLEENTDDFTEALISLKEKFFPDATDEEISTVQTFDDIQVLMANQFSKEFESFKTKYKQDLINNLLTDGLITKSQLSTSNISNINFSKNDLLDDLDKQKFIITSLYKKQGIPDKTIQKMINNLDDLEDEALEAYDELERLDKSEQKKLEDQYKKSEEERKKQMETFNMDITKELSTLSKVIPNKPLSDKDQKDILLNINSTLEKIGKNPAKYYAMLGFLDRQGILDGNFKSILQAGESIGNKKLENILSNKRLASGNSKRISESTSNISKVGTHSIYK